MSSLRHRPWLGFLFVQLILFCLLFDQLYTSIAAPDIEEQLGIGIERISLLFSVYFVTAGTMMLPLSWVADRMGRHRAAVLAAILFAVGTFVSAWTPKFETLIGARMITGLALGLGVPATWGLTNVLFPAGHARRVAFSFMIATIGTGGFVGAVCGGIFTAVHIPRDGYLIVTGIAVVAGMGVWAFVPRSPRSGIALDVPGTLLLVLGLGVSLTALGEGPNFGWWTSNRPLQIGGFIWSYSVSWVPVALTVGTLALASLGLVESLRRRQGKTLIIELNLFRSRSFSTGLACSTILTAIYATSYDFGPVFLRFATSFGPISIAVILSLVAAGIALGALARPSLSQRFGDRTVLRQAVLWQTGFFVIVFFFPLSGFHIVLWMVAHLFLGLIAGLTLTILSDVVLQDVPPGIAATGGGTLQTATNLASAIGALIVFVSISATGRSVMSEELREVSRLSRHEQAVFLQEASFRRVTLRGLPLTDRLVIAKKIAGRNFPKKAKVLRADLVQAFVWAARSHIAGSALLSVAVLFLIRGFPERRRTDL